MNNFSPNMLKTFDECPMKFFFKYVEKFSLPQSAKLFEKGKKVHALANYYLQGADISKMEKVLSPGEKSAWDNLKSSRYFKFKVVNTEYNLSCRIKNNGESYWIGGRLDALMADGDNYYILDYKTGNIPNNPEFDFQTIVYLLSVEKYLKSKKNPCTSLQFVYLGLKNNVEKSVLLDDALKKKYDARIVSVCANIDLAVNSSVFSKNKDFCNNCEFNKICN